MWLIQILNTLFAKVYSLFLRYKAYADDQRAIYKIKSSYRRLKTKRILSKKQVAEIQDFYRPLLGHSVPTDWHQYFYSRTGIFSKLYIPTSEYKNHLIGRLNIYPLHLAYNDKNMTDITLPNTRQPKILLKNMGGYFYTEGVAITREKAVNLCSDLGDVIVKPSLTGRGMGVKRVHLEGGKVNNTSQGIEGLFDEYKADFLIQRIIKQHSCMAALNSDSINTIRIVSYRSGMDIKIVYTVIRIGRKGMAVDNESAGGISARILPDGTISKYAYGAPGVDQVEYTDSGVRLEGYEVPSYDKALELVKKSHIQLPYFNLIGWDIAIEEDGEPIMIELNLNPDLSQSANGPAFGDYTKEILSDAMHRQNTRTPVTTICMNKRNYPKKNK